MCEKKDKINAIIVNIRQIAGGVVLSCLVYESAGLLVEYRADGVLSLGRGSSELKELRLEGDRRVQLHEGCREFVPRRDGSGGE